MRTILADNRIGVSTFIREVILHHGLELTYLETGRFKKLPADVANDLGDKIDQARKEKRIIPIRDDGAVKSRRSRKVSKMTSALDREIDRRMDAHALFLDSQKPLQSIGAEGGAADAGAVEGH